MRRFSIALVVALVVAALAGDAWACSCGGSESPCNAYRRSDVVFVGDVVAVNAESTDEYWSSVQIRVVRPGKGGLESGQVITLQVPSQRSSCSLDFAAGQRWFIFGSHGPTG